jgi:predicted deacetylase
VRPREIEIVIDELVLHGFNRADRHRIAAAIQQQLAAAFTNDISAGGIRSAEHVDAGEFSVAPHAKAAHVGEAAAGAIHKGLPR